MRRLLLLALASSLCACGPHLNHELRLERSYLSSADCAQGPFELKVPVLGSKWGEEIELVARGKAIRGSVKVVESGRDYGTWDFGTSGPWENGRCKLAPVASAPATVASEWAQPSFGPAPSKPVEPAVVLPAKEAPVELRVTEEPDKVMTYEERYSAHLTSITHHEVRVDQVGVTGLQPGGFWVITFWSAEPNDLAHVIFELKQHELVPSVPEVEYLAYLEKKKADDKADQVKRQQEADQRSDEWAKHQHECNEKLQSPECEDVRTAYQYRDKADQQHMHLVFCFNHVNDASCEDYRKDVEYSKQVKHLDSCRPHPNDPSCVDVREKLKTNGSSVPPPIARAEEQPPKPSEHAEWVPGSWVWDGWEYQWTGGGWRVPDSDIAAKLTVQAPAPPPEPRVEVSVAPRPVLGAVWVAGAWYWSGAGWVWIPGTWRMPPTPGLRWRPPVWVVGSRGVQLDPGRWVR
ncbi:MAG: hypothetical protein QM723_14315 [Myxococcaceae bacterium]